jgi:hypothetical protein
MNTSYAIFKRVAQGCAAGYVISFIACIWTGNMHWLAIAAVATGAGMLAFCNFLVGVLNELQSIKKPGILKFIVIVMFGVWGGVLFPLSFLYKIIM